MFRDKFWWTLGLTIPVVVWSADVQHWLGYTAPSFRGSKWIPAIFGTVVFAYAGIVFLRGARGELVDHKPGMMTLISLGILVSFGASLAATFGLFEVEVWWEVATLGDDHAIEEVSEAIRSLTLRSRAEYRAVLLQGLRTGRITHHGERFHYDDAPVHFEMLQKPYPRFWYAGNLQHAAEQGMNALGRGSREAVEEYWKIWQEGRVRLDPRFLGEDPMVGSTRHVVVADTEAEALTLARRAYRAYAEHFHATEVRIAGGAV